MSPRQLPWIVALLLSLALVGFAWTGYPPPSTDAPAFVVSAINWKLGRGLVNPLYSQVRLADPAAVAAQVRRDLVVLAPKPVGVGGTWTGSELMNAITGLTMDVATTYTLAAVTAAEATVEGSGTIEARAGAKASGDDLGSMLLRLLQVESGKETVKARS